MSEKLRNRQLEPADILLKRQTQWLLFLRVATLSALLGINVLLHTQDQKHLSPPIHYITYFIAALYLYTISSALLLKYIKKFINFAYLQIFSDIFLAGLLVLFSGGSQSIFTLIFFFPIISGGLMLSHFGNFTIASICTACYGGILFFEYLGYYPEIFYELHSPLHDIKVVIHLAAVPGLSFFLVSFLSSILSARFRKTEEALSRTTLDLDRLALLYKQIFDNITTGIITVDNHGRITSFNNASQDITGFTNNEILGESIDYRFPGLEKVDNDPIRPVIDLVRRDGEKIPVGYSSARLNMPDSMENSRVYTFQDLSQIKKMENLVRQAEKMAGIGKMAAGIAHEFRNPLAAISGAAQVLSQETLSPVNEKLMHIIIRESDRLELTINEFLQFSKPVSPEKRWFSLPKLLRETFQTLEQAPNWDRNWRPHIDMEENFDCWADPNQTKQIFLNLITNSYQAIGDAKGEIIISAREEQENNKAWTLIHIKDSGAGIPEKIIDKIYEPFLTTREDGTGLGLAIVWQIIDHHGGAIQVENNENRGATFTIKLPLP